MAYAEAGWSREPGVFRASSCVRNYSGVRRWSPGVEGSTGVLDNGHSARVGWSEDEWIGGDVAEGFGGVADAFRSNFRTRGEIGAAIAVYRDGDKVVDLWGGSRDPQGRRRWEADTLVPVFSTTKGMSAAAMAVGHSRGMFGLDEPVALYWPEFAQRDKGRVTVRELLAHEAGLAVIDQRLDLATIADFDSLGAVLAAQAPKWPPGTAHGYHAQTLGWYESQLLRRVDPAGRSIGAFFADEVAAPLGAQFFIGLPDEALLERIATFTGGGRIAAALHAYQMPKRLLLAMLNPRSMTARAFANPKALAMNMSIVNRPDVLRLEFPSMNGVGEVRAIAKVYGALATGGSELDLARTTLDELEANVTPSFDAIFRLDSAFTMGFMKPFPILPFGSTSRSYGHTGLGGSFGFADPDIGLGYAYAMNRGGYSLPTDPREVALRDAVYRST
jgi:CubicO group peptidase (beta-lactamase class C family)